MVGVSRGDANRVLMTDSRKIIISMDISFHESITVLENLEETSTSRINFALPGLESKYFGDAIIDSVEEATADAPDTPAPDSVQKLNSADIEEQDSTEWEYPFYSFTYYFGLRRSARHTAGVSSVRLNYCTGLVINVVQGNRHITVTSLCTDAMRSKRRPYCHKAMQDEFV